MCEREREFESIAIDNGLMAGGPTWREDALIWERPRVVNQRVYFSIRRWYWCQNPLDGPFPRRHLPLLSGISRRKCSPNYAQTRNRNPHPQPIIPRPETRSSRGEQDEPEARNQKPEARNPKPETRSPEPETRNPKPRDRNPKSQIPNSKLGTR